MSKWLATSCMGLMVLGGCAGKGKPAGSDASLANPDSATMSDSKAADRPSIVNQPSADASQVIAYVSGRPITLDQLRKPVFEAYGLQFLLHLVQLEMAKQRATLLGATVSPEDIAYERQLTLEQLFASATSPETMKLSEQEKKEFIRKEQERLLGQFLTMQRISRPEFELAMETGAYLRKIAQLQVKDKISEENLKEAFSIEYGEKVRVRHIQLANLREAAEARRRVDGGEAFEKVARELSRNTVTRQIGGEARPFSRNDRYWPAKFVEASFELKKPGDLSDIIQAGEAYHIIKLEERLAPKAVKFEDHKEILREKLYNLLLQVRSKQLREELATEARDVLKIQDPILRKQYQERMDRAAGETGADPDQIRRQMELDAKTPPADPNTTGPEVARPPATRPGI